jgi:hypothetical protein
VAESDQALQPGVGRGGTGRYGHGNDPSTSSTGRPNGVARAGDGGHARPADAAVARQLDVALPAADGSRTVAGSALSQARARLGPDPMEWLYLRTAEEWAHRSAGADRWRGLALYGTDGTALRVADSVENRDHFGGHNTGPHAGGRDERQSGYPLMRLVVVMAPGCCGHGHIGIMRNIECRTDGCNVRASERRDRASGPSLCNTSFAFVVRAKMLSVEV